MRVSLIGANGFVGSSFARLLLQKSGVELVTVTRQNYSACAGARSDVVIEAACNSKKFLADENPLADFQASVEHRLRTLRDFPAGLHLHISSVDVYSDLTSPATTREDTAIDFTKVSHYGAHKLLAEQLVRHYAPRWLILRLAGMVGPGLRKNPVFDILNGQPLRIHPDSRYQYLSTDEVARAAWQLVEGGVTGEMVNVCGDGAISMREIARLAGRELNLSAQTLGLTPRVVEASNEKIRRWTAISKTTDALADFFRNGSGAGG
jgi:nucleoside-diphosphate-sugar epimerase